MNNLVSRYKFNKMVIWIWIINHFCIVLFLIEVPFLGMLGPFRYQFSVGLYCGDHSPIAVLLQREQCGHVIQADLFYKN